MKIAVTYQDGEIFPHFGHTECFKIYEIADNEVKAAALMNSEGSGHGALAGLLEAEGVGTLICGGIGDGARQVLAQAGITLFGGVSGSVDRAVEDFLAGKLAFDPDAGCADGGEHHHGEHEHGEGHCGGNCHGSEH